MCEKMKKIDWAGVSIEERQRFIAEDMHIDHPQFVAAMLEIKRRMLRCANERVGAGILWLSPSGCGKTHALRYLKRSWPSTHTPCLTTVPVVTFEIPSGPTPRAMGVALLRATGTGESYATGNSADLLERISKLIPKIGTQLIVIDNVQDVPEKGNEKGIKAIGVWIRTLIEGSKVLVVLLGTPAAENIVSANSQLRRRAAKRLHMDYFHFDDPLSKANFCKVLKQIDEALPLAELSGIDAEDMAESIYYSTYGIPDYIFQLLIEAIGVAVQDGREKIVKSDLAKAYFLNFQESGKNVNPFVASGAHRKLTENGEPFFNWFDSSNPELKRRKSQMDKL